MYRAILATLLVPLLVSCQTGGSLVGSAGTSLASTEYDGIWVGNRSCLERNGDRFVGKRIMTIENGKAKLKHREFAPSYRESLTGEVDGDKLSLIGNVTAIDGSSGGFWFYGDFQGDRYIADGNSNWWVGCSLKLTRKPLSPSKPLSEQKQQDIIQERLLQAVLEGDAAGVKALLDQGADVNARDKYGATPLVVAVFIGSKETIQLLLGHGADVNVQGGALEWTTLMVAAAGTCNKETLRLLLELPPEEVARIFTDVCNNTPLISVAGKGDKDTIRLLLDRGADVNARGNTGLTALILAARNGDKDTVRLLLDHGADVNVADNSAADLAVKFPSLKRLLERAVARAIAREQVQEPPPPLTGGWSVQTALATAKKEQTEIERKIREEPQKAAQAERRRQEEQARLAAVAERHRQEEQARLAAVAERQRQEEQAKLAAVAERQRQEEQARLAAEAERQRQEEQARLAAEKKRRQIVAQLRKQQEEATRKAEEKQRRQEELARLAAKDKRLALVIGNSNYRVGQLANPANDARLIAKTLRSLNFEVLEHTDLRKEAMQEAIVDFGERLDRAGEDAVGLFFYAGHGIQAQGQNYLVPLGVDLKREAHLTIYAVEANWVLAQMEAADNAMNLVVLDACRDNPFTRSWKRGTSRGLVRMEAPRGTLIAYATRPGDVAADGIGKNSPYSAALAQSMVKPGLSLSDMFIEVRNRVMASTNEEQVPWEEGGLTSKFYFKPLEKAKPSPVQATMGSSVEMLFWQSIQDSDDASDFEAYLSQYPNGAFSALARNRLNKMRQR